MRVTSTIKAVGGSPWTVELGPFTLVIGPNGGGKTAIRQALEAADGLGPLEAVEGILDARAQ